MTQILVIEDDAEVRDNIVDTLEAAGFLVHDAANGRLGLQAAHEHHPDVVICDITMPELDGYGVLKALRGDPTTNTLPFVFLTAKMERIDQRLGMELGADDYITKPFTQNELLTAIKAQIAKREVITEKYETAINKLRKNIIYALPHELRTPLSQIVGFADLLNVDADALDAAGVREMSGFILKAGNRLQRMIENYLVYAQLEIIGDRASEIKAFTNHIIRDAASVIAERAGTTAANAGRLDDLTLELEPAAIAVSAENLRKIVEELTHNAFKFSEPGTLVYVKAMKTEDQYIVSIRDHGRGMTAEQISEVGAYMQFDREFYEQQGLGLGFIIAKRLITLHKGQIQIDSAPGQGTEVCFSFPA